MCRHISYVGHSAGAHLIMCMLNAATTINNKWTTAVKNIFLISGVYDVTDLRSTSINANNLLGLNDDNLAALSPIKFDLSTLLLMNDSGMRFFVYVAEHDSPTFIRQSKKLHDRFQESGVHSTFNLVAGCDHFDIVEQLNNLNFQITLAIRENI